MYVFNTYLFTIYHGPGTVLNTEEIMMSIRFVLLDLIVWRVR